jgi:hypothetical protein
VYLPQHVSRKPEYYQHIFFQNVAPTLQKTLCRHFKG